MISPIALLSSRRAKRAGWQLCATSPMNTSSSAGENGFSPKNGRNGPFRAFSGKNRINDPFFAEKPFSPADELVFMGLVARSCHFDVTACAEARRLAQRAERPLRAFRPFGPAGALRAPAGKTSY